MQIQFQYSHEVLLPLQQGVEHVFTEKDAQGSPISIRITSPVPMSFGRDDEVGLVIAETVGPV